MTLSPPRRHAGLALATLIVFGIISPRLDAKDRFQEDFAPFARKYCARCHDDKQARGELNLSRYSEDRHVTADFRRWNHIIEFVRDGAMPPEDEPQPTIEERNKVVGTLEAILLDEARKHAGDPGVVLPRRLSNTEYDRSIRDLTGVDIRPTRDFPPDPAAGEGFDNTGEALGMSPSLLKKYLSAAQNVSEHLVLKTGGIAFAPFPVTSYNEQKKLTEQAIIDFYQSHEVRIADYLEAAWRYRYRGNSDKAVAIGEWAERRGLSGKYLASVAHTLGNASQGAGFLKRLGQLWDAVPAPVESASRPRELDDVERYIAFCQRQLGYREEALIRSNAGNWPISHLDFRARSAAERDRFDPNNFRPQKSFRFDRLPMPKADKTNSDGVALYLRFDRAFDNADEGKGEEGIVVVRRPVFSKSDRPPRNDEEARSHEVQSLREVLEAFAPEVARKLAFGAPLRGIEVDADSFAVRTPALVEIPLSADVLDKVAGKHLLLGCELPATRTEGSALVQHAIGNPPQDAFAMDAELLIHGDSQMARSLTESAERFCATFPNRFFYVDSERGLAAGFHLVDGFFRDDLPLMQKVLDDRQRQELDQLWRELDFATKSAETLLRGFVWFERSERHVLHDEQFDFLRAEDPRLVEHEMLERFEKAYLRKMGVKLVEGTLEPKTSDPKFDLIHTFFVRIREGLALYHEQLKVAEQRALVDLDELAERAYRRPLEGNESKSLRKLYDDLRTRGQSVEGSLRGVFMAVLMSPHFFYHYRETPGGGDVYPLSDDALANRLSYFLWSAPPDEALRAAAREGTLRDEATLVAQTRRMLADSRIDGFAREFFGQWLRYRDYLSKDPINADAFPGYDDELREAMFEEPVRLAMHLVQQDKPITDLLGSDITFVNGALARHYGGEIARQYNQRTKDSTGWHRIDGLREMGRGGLFGMGVILTSTSKGERTSPVKRGFWAVHHLLGQHFPPPPADVPELPLTEKVADRSIRELIVQHTADPKCAMCHVHFDSLGMALEGFDPIGRARTKDLAGRNIDDVAVLPSGETAKGLSGLIEYIEGHRRQDFVRTMCRKFLGYALGRSVVLSDQPLLMKLEAELERNEYRFSALFESVVRSPQFRRQRGDDFVVGSR